MIEWVWDHIRVCVPDYRRFNREVVIGCVVEKCAIFNGASWANANWVEACGMRRCGYVSNGGVDDTRD